MEPAAKKRFSNLTSQEIDQMVVNKDSENTKKATKTAVATLIEFCRETKRETANFDEMSREELNQLLIAFLPKTNKEKSLIP